MYKRKTKDVECERCGETNRVPKEQKIANMCCVRKLRGKRCMGRLRLKKRLIQDKELLNDIRLWGCNTIDDETKNSLLKNGWRDR